MTLNIDKEMSKKFQWSHLGKLVSGLYWDLCMFNQSSEKKKLESPGTFQHTAFVAGNIENYVSP